MSDDLKPCPFCGGKKNTICRTYVPEQEHIAKICQQLLICSRAGTYSQNIPKTAYLFPSGNIRPCIEQLEERNKELTLQLLAASGQAAVALAKLAKAVEALRQIEADCDADYPPSHRAIKYAIRTALAELEAKE
jgi:hypothetical protein